MIKNINKTQTYKKETNIKSSDKDYKQEPKDVFSQLK